MNRVEAAIEQGRCVLALGGRAIAEPEVLAELRRRSAIPSVVLGSDPVQPAVNVSADALAPATSSPGGVLVLIEPDAAVDGRALAELSTALGRAPNKPRLVVAARSFNPFMLPMGMRLMKMEQEKDRGADFLAKLPVPAGSGAVEASPGKKKRSKRSGPDAPSFEVLGRDEELPAVRELLAKGGPMALVGPRGVGRRWLVERALATQEGEEAHAASELTRLPDFRVRKGSAFDSLIARIAELSGDEALQAALRSSDASAPLQLIELALAALSAESLAGKLMLVTGLRSVQAADGAIFAEDRLGLLLKALLTNTYALRLVFVTDRAPVFFREGEGQHLDTYTVGGLRGRELFGIFEAYHAGEAPRDKMGEVHNRTLGHAMATRAFAIAWRDYEQPDKVMEDKRFLKLGQIENIEPLERHLRRRVDKLDDKLRDALVRIGHFPIPVTGQLLSMMDIPRDVRITLCRRGLLEAMPATSPRRYYVHPLVRQLIGGRALSDFSTLEEAGRAMFSLTQELEGLPLFAMKQELNRLAIAARRPRNRVALGYPDNDPIIETVKGILRARAPRFDIALQRINEGLKEDAGNTELWQLKAEVLAGENDTRAEAEAALKDAEQSCPTPGLYHFMATFYSRQKKGRAKALLALERGCAAFTTDAGLRRRYGALLADLGRMSDAEAALREAMDLEPMAPDTYSRLGEVLLSQGPERWGDAEDLLRHALEQEPGDPMHLARIGRLQRRRAMLAEPTDATALRDQAKENLEEALKGIKTLAWPFLEMTLLLLETDGDLDRAEWCAKKAKKLSSGRDPEVVVAMARVHARSNRQSDAEAQIQRVLKGREAVHLATAALAELYALQGKIFLADAQLGQAIKLAPEGSPEAAAWAKEKARLEALITSGQAVEIERAAEQAQAEAEATGARDVKTQSDRGNTTVRRIGGRHGEQVRGHDEADAAVDNTDQAVDVAEQAAEVAAEIADAAAEVIDHLVEAAQELVSSADEQAVQQAADDADAEAVDAGEE
ncbi:MAG: hypothetical protein H6741_34045 [Alphaproteobacteria bacterium]|nr:hypothetical protein [Alphaproteobacteria bacterium]